MPQTKFEKSLIFLDFLRSLRGSATHEVTRTQSLLYQRSSAALLLVNQTNTKMLNCFITLFQRLYLTNGTKETKWFSNTYY